MGWQNLLLTWTTIVVSCRQNSITVSWRNATDCFQSFTNTSSFLNKRVGPKHLTNTLQWISFSKMWILHNLSSLQSSINIFFVNKLHPLDCLNCIILLVNISTNTIQFIFSTLYQNNLKIYVYLQNLRLVDVKEILGHQYFGYNLIKEYFCICQSHVLKVTIDCTGQNVNQ